MPREMKLGRVVSFRLKNGKSDASLGYESFEFHGLFFSTQYIVIKVVKLTKA